MSNQLQAIRVLTFNVLSADQADWEHRRLVARAGLQAVNPDIAALQETVPGQGSEQAIDLLGSGYHVTEHPSRSEDQVGAVLASRWPLKVVAEVDLAVPPRVATATAVIAQVELPAPFGLTLFVHHGAAYQFGYAREREVQAVRCARVVDDLARDRDAHVVLLGDFNDSPDSASVRFWTGRQSLEGFSVAYLDAWEAAHPDDPGHTFSPTNPLVRAGQMPLEPGRRIDYIMIRSGIHGPTLAVADCRHVLNRPVNGFWPSDHFGILVDLVLPPHAPGRWARQIPSTSVHG